MMTAHFSSNTKLTHNSNTLSRKAQTIYSLIQKLSNKCHSSSSTPTTVKQTQSRWQAMSTAKLITNSSIRCPLPTKWWLLNHRLKVHRVVASSRWRPMAKVWVKLLAPHKLLIMLSEPLTRLWKRWRIHLCPKFIASSRLLAVRHSPTRWLEIHMMRVRTSIAMRCLSSSHTVNSKSSSHTCSSIGQSSHRQLITRRN